MSEAVTNGGRQNQIEISAGEAVKRHLLSEADLNRLHLSPTGAPIAFSRTATGGKILYYHPSRVKVAPTVEAKRVSAPAKKPSLPPPTREGELPTVSMRRATKLGLYTASALAQMYLAPKGCAVAQFVRRDGKVFLLFDRENCDKLPRPCIRCGKGERFCHKLCRDCYREEIKQRRAEGDARRNACYGLSREKVLFFDLELTGLYDYDEVLSVSIVNGKGEVVLHSLVRPVRRKKWKRTEEIHGITPEMVKDSPTFEELAPRLREIFDGAERVVAYGTATDFSHLRRLYATRSARDRLHGKLLDCAAEFSRFVTEHEIEMEHRSLSDAMAHFGLSWEGLAHTSLADTFACRLVFEALFPHYFERKE